MVSIVAFAFLVFLLVAFLSLGVSSFGSGSILGLRILWFVSSLSAASSVSCSFGAFALGLFGLRSLLLLLFALHFKNEITRVTSQINILVKN